MERGGKKGMGCWGEGPNCRRIAGNNAGICTNGRKQIEKVLSGRSKAERRRVQGIDEKNCKNPHEKNSRHRGERSKERATKHGKGESIRE